MLVVIKRIQINRAMWSWQIHGMICATTVNTVTIYAPGHNESKNVLGINWRVKKRGWSVIDNVILDQHLVIDGTFSALGF